MVMLLTSAACSGGANGTGTASTSPAGPVVGGPPVSVSAPTSSTSSTVTVTTGPVTSEGEASGSAASSVPAEQLCEGSGTVSRPDLAYAHLEGVDPSLLSLDVYEPVLAAGCPPPPVMVYVHGGGWAVGDKAQGVADKIEWFNARGWVFVSVNYRLSPEVPSADPDRVMYPDHNEDVAAAIAFVARSADRFGADPGRLFLMGHSAGAAIVAAVATDPRYLDAWGMSPADLSCVVLLDTAGYDVTTQMELGVNPDMWRNAFGDDPEVWADASPVNHVAPGNDLPGFLAVVRGNAGRIARTVDFVDLLTEAGYRAQVLDAGDLDHAGVNAAVGRPDDEVVTPAVESFLTECLEQPV